MKTRNETIFEMYKKYYRLTDIAKKYGISRQRVWQIIKHYFIKNKPKKIRSKDASYLIRSTPSENFVYKKLRKLKIKYKPTGMGDYYDVLIGNKKVEIKYRSKPYHNFYCFNNLISMYPIDYYIFVCGELNKTAKFYIYPSKKVKNNLKLQDNYISRKIPVSNKYFESWVSFAD